MLRLLLEALERGLEICRGEAAAENERLFAEALLVYALGRGLDRADACAVRGIVENAEAYGNTIPSFVLGVVECVPFQMRNVEDAVDDRGPTRLERSSSADYLE